jgi:hypothetical protein
VTGLLVLVIVILLLANARKWRCWTTEHAWGARQTVKAWRRQGRYEVRDDHVVQRCTRCSAIRRVG